MGKFTAKGIHKWTTERVKRATNGPGHQTYVNRNSREGGGRAIFIECVAEIWLGDKILQERRRPKQWRYVRNAEAGGHECGSPSSPLRRALSRLGKPKPLAWNPTWPLFAGLWMLCAAIPAQGQTHPLIRPFSPGKRPAGCGFGLNISSPTQPFLFLNPL